jgi:hypothetical protein
MSENVCICGHPLEDHDEDFECTQLDCDCVEYEENVEAEEEA